VPLTETEARLRIFSLARGQPYDAEVLGCPLSGGYTYPLRPGSSFPVWTYNGCSVRIWGSEAFRNTCAYRAPSTHYRAVVETHGIVHRLREQCKSRSLDPELQKRQTDPRSMLRDPSTSTIGPRVVVCGGQSSGRHSVARTLANYAVRHPAGWAPTFVDLDPNHQTFGPTCTMGVGAWDYCSTVDEDVLHINAALFWAGSPTPMATPTPDLEPGTASAGVSAVVKDAAGNAVRAATERLVTHAATPVGWSGSVIVAPAVPDPVAGADFVAGIINAGFATHVLVVGDPDLHAALSHRFDATLSPAIPRDSGVFTTAHGTPFTLDALSASPGAIDVALPAIEAAHRNHRLRAFFFGPSPGLQLVPLRIDVPFAFIDIVRWVDIEGQATPQRVAEAKYNQVAEKRIGAVYRAKDSLARSPMVFPCHVDSVEGSNVSLRVCGVLRRDAGEILTVAVGSVAWLE
jgi:hypothetical protein